MGWNRLRHAPGTSRQPHPAQRGAQICLDEAVQYDFPVGTYLKVMYTEVNGRKFARGISQSDSFHALDATP